MLISLSIKNFVIVKQLTLEFSAGMTVFTGETGAGKSIMIDALMLVLGARADSSMIRVGEKKCDITAIFNYTKNSEPELWLAEHELLGDEQNIILRRVIYREGSSKTFINGHPLPLQKIKELGKMLVQIHGQHQHQTLMQHSTHRLQLDRYASIQAVVTKVSNLYQQAEATKQLLAKNYNHKLNDQIKLLQFQIAELAALNMQQDELQNLHDEHQQLHNATTYLSNAEQLINLLDGEAEPTICQNLNLCLQLIHSLPQKQTLVQNATSLLQTALIQCREAQAELQNFSYQVELNPPRLQEIEDRLSTLHHTARKYHVELSQLLPYLHELEQKLQALAAKIITREKLQQEYAAQLNEFDKAALSLSNLRKQHAPILAAAITAKMQELGMNNGWLEVNITNTDKKHACGIDHVEYKICTNLGANPAPLAQIVSGGELSRISLAIQIITAQQGVTPTLLFDEVDVGIGGATAAIVGQLLRKLGERLQVFCITHQPQVAACGHHHFCVEKYIDEEQTYSQIRPLNNAQKITEVARMLGGLTITAQTRLHAQELLQQNVGV